MSGVEVRVVAEDWLRGRLAECREELAAAKVGRRTWEIEEEIEDLEYLLGEQS